MWINRGTWRSRLPWNDRARSTAALAAGYGRESTVPTGTVSRYRDIYQAVKRIPRGSVASYGRIARMVNCTARQVGYAMAATPPGQSIPWHRVINSKGEISARKQGGGDQRQKQKLLSEGVVFDQKGRVDFDRFGWVESEWPVLDGAL